MKLLFYLATVTLAFSASSVAADLTAEVPKGDPEFTAKAMSAAQRISGRMPQSLGYREGFKLTPIKTGTNGWTCAVGPGGPWCADAAGLEWFRAISTKAEPPDKTGFVYMFAGDTGTSNHDPYATDKSHWVRTGPHVMIVGKAAHEMAAGYPNTMDPNPKQPYVMYPGTKYEHLMFPADTAGHSQ